MGLKFLQSRAETGLVHRVQEKLSRFSDIF